MKVSVIVPTYQERNNIKSVIEQIGTALSNRDYEIIVIDDNSPDGTAEIASDLTNSYPIRVIKREDIRGLGSAIIEGFRNAQGDLIGVIDADLQHPPELLSILTATIEGGYDIAVASRYATGGDIEEWPFIRRLVSKGAILLARPLTKVKDPMSGYFMLKKEIVDGKDFNSKGFKILLGILVRGKYDQVEEVPYTFRNRQNGKSKLGSIEYIRYLRLLIDLYLHQLRKSLLRSDK